MFTEVIHMGTEKMIKDAVKNGKILMGRNSVARALKAGSLEAVVCPTNCPADLTKELDYYSKVSKVPIEKFEGNSAALGQLCGKPFKIVTLGIEK